MTPKAPSSYCGKKSGEDWALHRYDKSGATVNYVANFTQSLGWEHYEVHEPEPHILLFKYIQQVCVLVL
jgi:hypothetical protein